MSFLGLIRLNAQAYVKGYGSRESLILKSWVQRLLRSRGNVRAEVITNVIPSEPQLYFCFIRIDKDAPKTLSEIVGALSDRRQVHGLGWVCGFTAYHFPTYQRLDKPYEH